MNGTASQFGPDERGQALPEYAAILAVVCLGVVLALVLLGRTTGNLFGHTASSVDRQKAGYDVGNYWLTSGIDPIPSPGPKDEPRDSKDEPPDSSSGSPDSVSN